jgi:WD40 repeat protein
LEIVRKAAAIRPDLEARNEAIACLAVSDLRLVTLGNYGTPDPPGQICLAPSLEQYATAEGRENVTIRAVTDEHEVEVLEAGGCAVNWLYCFSPDSQFLAVGYSSQVAGDNAWVWDVPHKKVVLQGLPGKWRGAAFGPDSRSFVWSNPDGSLSFYDLASGKETKRLAVQGQFRDLAFTLDGTRLACVTYNNPLLQILDVESNRMNQTLKAPAGITSAAWSPDGKILATGCDDGRICLWQVETATLRSIIAGHADIVISAGFTHRGNLLATSSWDYTTRLWDPETGRALVSYAANSFPVQFGPDDQRLGVSVADKGLCRMGLLEVAHNHEFGRLHSQHAGREASIPGFNADGRVLVAGAAGCERFWDVLSGKEIAAFVPEGWCDTAIFHPDGRRLITTERDAGIFVRALQRVPAGYRLSQPRRLYHAPDPREAALSLDGRHLAVVTDHAGGQAMIFDLDDPAATVVLGPHPLIDFIAITPDAHWVATGATWNSEVRVWDALSGKLVKTLALKAPSRVAFSPDGHWLATTGLEYQLWEVGSWQRSGAPVPAHPASNYRFLAFSPDSRVMALVKDGRAIQLLDPSTGQPLATLEAPDASFIFALCFTPDGSLLAALEGDQQVQLWDLRLIREQLKQMNLDWDLPAYLPVQGSASAGPVTLNIELAAGQLVKEVDFFARRGQWREAAAEAAKAIELQPDDHSLYHSLAPLLVAGRDLDSYRQLCQSITRRFRGAKDPFIGDRMAKDCLILPSSGADLAAVSELADTAVTLGESNRFLPYFEFSKGLAEYRLGHFANALAWTRKTIDIGEHRNGHAWDNYLYVEAYAVSAMAQFQMKQTDEAHVALAKGGHAESNLPALDSGELGDIWRDCIIAHTLMGEAKALIEGDSKPGQ